MTNAEYKRLTLKQMQQRRWKTARAIGSGVMRIPEGVEVAIREKSGGLSIGSPACPHCGVSIHMRKVCPHDLREIYAHESAAEQPPE